VQHNFKQSPHFAANPVWRYALFLENAFDGALRHGLWLPPFGHDSDKSGAQQAAILVRLELRLGTLSTDFTFDLSKVSTDLTVFEAAITAPGAFEGMLTEFIRHAARHASIGMKVVLLLFVVGASEQR